MGYEKELKEFWDKVDALNEDGLSLLRPGEEAPKGKRNYSKLKSAGKLRWRRDMMIGIRAAGIALRSQEFLKQGRGSPGPDDLCRFSAEAEVVAQLWKDTYLAERDELEVKDRVIRCPVKDRAIR